MCVCVCVCVGSEGASSDQIYQSALLRSSIWWTISISQSSFVSNELIEIINTTLARYVVLSSLYLHTGIVDRMGKDLSQQISD